MQDVHHVLESILTGQSAETLDSCNLSESVTLDVNQTHQLASDTRFVHTLTIAYIRQ